MGLQRASQSQAGGLVALRGAGPMEGQATFLSFGS